MKLSTVTLSLMYLITVNYASIYDHVNLKSGILTQNETWSGKIVLSEDVIVPKDLILNIADDTWIIFNNFDYNNKGLYENQTELIVYGTLEMNNKDSIQIMPITDSRLDYLKDQALTKTITPTPYDTTPLKDQLRGYRHQYSIIWTIAYGILLL